MVATKDDREATEFLANLSIVHKAEQPIRQRATGRRANFFALDGIQNSSRGGFRGGQFDRLTEEWNPGNVGPNSAHMNGAAVMRQRARDLVLNNPFATSVIDAYVSNVIETGITPKPSFADRSARQQWVAAFNRWSGSTAHASRDADLTGQDTFYEMQALWLTEMIVAGGCLVHYIEMPRKGRSVPLAIELIPEERFFEENQWSGPNRKTANSIVNGVEIDKRTGRPVAYWVTNGDDTFNPVRIDRSQCEYGFIRKRIGQQRGFSWLHSAIVWLWALGYYADNELIASNAKSSYAYMIKTSGDAEFDWNSIQGSSCTSGTTDYYGNPIQRHESGMIFRGLPGDDIAAVGPNVPGSDSASWIEMILRSISIGTGLSYEEVCRDYSKGSFSSVRGSANADRRRFRRIWKLVDNHFNNPTWSRFASAGVRSGLDGFPSTTEFASDPDPWLAIKWEGPSWESVNPSDDALADDIRIKNGTKLRAECIPGDIDEHFEALARERDSIEQHGLNFEVGMVDPAAAGSTDQQLSQRDSKPQSGKAKK